VWDKGWGQPAMQVGVMNRQSELVLIFADKNAISRQFKSFCHFDRGTLSDVWQIKRGRTKDSKNKAVMPDELVDKILVNFTEEGDVVYDPFCGTGTTAFVANQRGRQYVGSEISSELIATANRRLREVQKPLI
jgi:site-specific DNA-methyltransferase (adenine-specific)